MRDAPGIWNFVVLNIIQHSLTAYCRCSDLSVVLQMKQKMKIN